MLSPRIYLASQSPRRRELLQQIGVEFDTLLFRAGTRADHDVLEDALSGERVDDYVQRVARLKAEGGLSRMVARGLRAQPVLAADTTLDVDGTIVGKPRDPDDAAAILRRLSGRSHRVLTAVAVADGRRLEQCLSVSEVRFCSLDPITIRRYLATGEPYDKAGAYAIQGRAAAFIEAINGSYSGIMGLPLFETTRLLRSFGFPV